MLRYGLYARKSDDDTSVTEKSLADQVGELQPLADREGLLIIHKWTESKSAKIPYLRPMWTKMITLLEKGEIDAILTWHINRLVRNMEEGGKLVQMFVDGKIKEIKTPGGTYRAGDNILPLVIEAASAAQYSIDLSRRVAVGLKGNFKNGGCNYKTPHGYRNERDPMNLKKGIVVKDDGRFVLVRKAWDLFLTGAYTIPEIVDTLNDQWLFRSKPAKKRPSGKLTYSAAYKLFSNPFYAGYVKHKGELQPGNHEAMISAAEFAVAQEILNRTVIRRKATPTRTYAYTGFMRCAYCGRTIAGESRTLNSSGQLWENYRCVDYQRTCTQMGMSSAKVEGFILEALDSISIEPWYCKIAFANIIRFIDGETRNVEVLHNQQETTLRALETKLSNLAEMWLSGMLTDSEVFKQKEKELKDAKNKAVIDVEASRLKIDGMRANAKAVEQYILFARDRFCMASPAVKREIALELAETFEFYGREKVIRINIKQLLRDVVAFTHSIKEKLEPFEPEIIRSYNEKAGAFTPVFSFGGTEELQFDVPENILIGLQTHAFHNFDSPLNEGK